jgi:sialidase-1
LAFAEGRRDSAGDSGAIEVVPRSSATAAAPGVHCRWPSNGEATAGNPSPLLTRSGDLVLLTTRNGRVSEAEIVSGKVSEQDTLRVFVQRSKDNGRTWTAATDITAETKQANWHIGFSDDRSDGVTAANETTVTELPNGRLYFSSRNQGSAPEHRVDAYSADGGKTLTAPYQLQETPYRAQGSRQCAANRGP